MMKNNEFKNKVDTIIKKEENIKVRTLKIALEALKLMEKTSKAS